MYANHQPIIQAYAHSSPQALATVCAMAILPIRRPFFDIPADTDDWRDGRAEENGVLYGWKSGAVEYINRNADAIAWHCGVAMLHGGPDSLVEYLATLPGLGLVKGGFVAQMVRGVSGCVDSINAALFGIGRKTFDNTVKPRSPATRERNVIKYNALVERLGGTETLWNEWCAHQAKKAPQRYASAFAVSAMHLEALGLEE